MYSHVTSDQLLKILNNSLVNLPTPSSISMFWNLGSLLGLCLMTQLLTGVLLAMHYSSDVGLAFNSIDHLMRDVNLGWLLRIIHANGASLFFISLYFHMSRGLYYSSYQTTQVWMSGVTILFLVMATAFLGYVLPWGQMSFWGATVITNLFSAIPYFGGDIVFWLWGGYAVSQPTLSRFFSFHFLIPFLISGLVLVHMLFLHNSGSSNPLGLNSNFDKILFHPYFTWKDLLGFILALFLFFYLSFMYPWMLGDPENFIPANPLVTPLHIQPEWYFLFAYAILRSIPNKLGGVVALIASVAILYTLPLVTSTKFKSLGFNPLNKKLMWNFVGVFFALTWIGARPVETPYILIGQLLTVVYFLIIFSWPLNLK